MSKILIIPTLVIIGLIAVGVNAAVTHYFVGMEFEREVEIYFDYADQASDAKTKAEYFNQFVTAVETHGLTEGPVSMFWQEQPQSQLEEKYKVAKSLQKRLNEIAQMDEMSEEYQYGMRQVTTQEFCWFPINSFHDAYMLRHNAWGDALAPPAPYNLCGSSD
jgi:capsular polysaccharide biosynthesis protein